MYLLGAEKSLVSSYEGVFFETANVTANVSTAVIEHRTSPSEIEHHEGDVVSYLCLARFVLHKVRNP